MIVPKIIRMPEQTWDQISVAAKKEFYSSNTHYILAAVREKLERDLKC